MGMYSYMLAWSLFTLVCFLLIIIIINYKRRIAIYEKQEKEIEMYRMYVKPLEQFINEIRAKQHEFDNHINALLSMHITIDNYDELVNEQTKYMRSLIARKENKLFPLLRISNKILAGFLYSKLISIKEEVIIELMVGSNEIFTNVPERDVVEVMGTLIDNAYDAYKEESNKIKIFLTSKDEKIIFVIKNKHEKITLSELGHFFEQGYSTKSKEGSRGFGLYHARNIVRQWNGELYVENEIIEEENYVSFRVEL